MRGLIISLSLILSLFSAAQNKSFPEAEALYSKLACELVIKDNNGELTATRNITEDILLSTENAAKMMSRGYIHHSSFSELKKWDAYTHVPGENKKFKIANTSVNSSTQNYIFYDDAKSTNFDFTGVQAGATRHLEYQLEHKDLHMLMPHYFDRHFPVLNSELKIVFPNSVKLRYVIKGLHADKVTFTEQKKKDKTTYTFTVNDLPAEQNYKDAPDDSYYATHIVFFVEQVEKYGTWKNYLSNVQDLYQYNYNFIKDLNQSISTELLHLTDSIIKGTVTQHDKAKRIYNWVQTNIKYVAFEEGLEGFIPRPANLVCSRRFGDCKDMASILTVMLKHAKVPAYFTWIGTRDLPYTYAETPTPIVDNHMICVAQINDEWIFLDGTDADCLYGMPSSGIQGKEALLAIDADNFKVIKVPVVSKEQNKMIDSTFLELKDKVLTGKMKIYFTGYYASLIRSVLRMRNEKERTDFFKARFGRGSSKINFKDWKVSDNSSELIITASFELPDYAKKVGDDYLINLNLFKWYEHEEIDYPKRKSPITFDFLDSRSYTTLLSIPSGYKLSSIPKGQTFKNDVWGFQMSYSATEQWIALSQKFETNYLMLNPDQFKQWNEVLENLFPHYKQSAVLTKKLN